MNWYLFLIGATCGWLLSYYIGGWRALKLQRAHESWHQLQVQSMRERISACEIIVHRLDPVGFQEVQEKLHSTLVELSRNDSPTVERKV